MHLEGRGPSGFMSGEGTVRLAAAAGGTLLRYDLDAQVGGKIAGLGQRLLESSTKAVAQQGLEGLERQLAALHGGGDEDGRGAAGSGSGAVTTPAAGPGEPAAGASPHRSGERTGGGGTSDGTGTPPPHRRPKPPSRSAWRGRWRATWYRRSSAAPCSPAPASSPVCCSASGWAGGGDGFARSMSPQEELVVHGHPPVRRLGQEGHYGVDEVPRPFPRALGLGCSTCWPCSGPLCGAAALGPAMKMSPAQIALLVSSVMICSGLATSVQGRSGTRLPIIQGVSFSSSARSSPSSPLPAAVPARCSRSPRHPRRRRGGIFVGFSTLFGAWAPDEPVVIGPVIALIGLALFQVGAARRGRAGGSPASSSSASSSSRSSWRGASAPLAVPILIAVGVGYAAAAELTLPGVYGPGDAGYVTSLPSPPRRGCGGRARSCLRGTAALPSRLLPRRPRRLPGLDDRVVRRRLRHRPPSGEPEPTARQVDRGIGAEGIGCALTGLFGGFSSTSYTENIGLVARTRVASRYVDYVAAALLVLLGLVAKVGAAVATIPDAGGRRALLALFGLISVIGLSIWRPCRSREPANQLIIGFSLFMELSLRRGSRGCRRSASSRSRCRSRRRRGSPTWWRRSARREWR